MAGGPNSPNVKTNVLTLESSNFVQLCSPVNSASNNDVNNPPSNDTFHHGDGGDDVHDQCHKRLPALACRPVSSMSDRLAKGYGLQKKLP